MREHVLSGAVLPVYKIVTDVLGMKADAANAEPEETTRRNQNVTVVSTETTDDQRRKIVGLYLPSSEAAQDLREAIESRTSSTG
jgi:PHP family Zn ribbon phosphoesterase